MALQLVVSAQCLVITEERFQNESWTEIWDVTSVAVAGAGPTPEFLLDLLAREILVFKDYFLCLFISEKIKNK